MNFSKHKLVFGFLTAYVILTGCYFILQILGGVQSGMQNRAFEEGQRITVEQLMQQANSSCEPFFVYTEEASVQLVNQACLVPEEPEQQL
jgi:hypothetical protein